MQRQRAPIDPVRRLPEKATRANAPGCGAYVPTRACFGKAREPSFRDFMTAKTPQLARNSAKAEPWEQEKLGIWGDSRDGYVRFCRGWRRFRGLRGRKPPLRGAQNTGAAGCSLRQERH